MVFFAYILALLPLCTPTVVKDPELPNNGAVARMKEMGVGWNLGNNLDALPDGFSDSDAKYGWPDETCWYLDWLEELDERIKAKKGDEDYVKSTFGDLLERYVKKDIPVYLGEFGCSMRNKSDNRSWKFYLYWLEYVTKAARAYCFPAGIWDSGGRDTYGPEKHCYTDHSMGSFLSSGEIPLKTVINAWTNEDPSYTLQSVYNKAPVF